MENQINNSKMQVRLPLFLALALISGILLGATMFGGGANMKKVISGYEKIREILTYVERDYVDTVNTEDLIDYSIDKMLEKLDPHTAYIPAKKVALANTQLEGGFDGIGIEFNIFKDTIYVVTPLSGGPSEAVGLQSGDKIVEVDGKNVAGIGIDNLGVFKLLRGPKGTKVTLGIKRRNAEKLISFTIIRDKIPSYSVDASYMIDDKTGYIKVSRFAENTYKEFREAMLKLNGKGMQRLILDLRGNPGGYMDRAINMADEMIPGNPKIVYTDGKGYRYDSEAKAYITGLFEKGALIVLIDEGSASASEIVAGAIQDNDRGLIVGRRSFGKGLVQAPISLTDGSELRLTISRYYTPSGRSIQKPYSPQDANKDYDKDLLERYKKGEFFNADSIKQNEKLKYKTAKGRTVYGGGGIMPDVFIPLDTTINLSYLNELYNENIIREFSLNYYNDNKANLSKMTASAYIANFEVDEALLSQVLKMADKAKIKYDEKRYQSAKRYIQQHIKAWIARSVWGTDEFYTIWNQQDEIYEKALQLFEKAAALERGEF
ncbi:MAG TPA: peptidase S41 [Microscillaceae bacterium]|nr:peptidase S41 [Microscillaceae bacterium]